MNGSLKQRMTKYADENPPPFMPSIVLPESEAPQGGIGNSAISSFSQQGGGDILTSLMQMFMGGGAGAGTAASPMGGGFAGGASAFPNALGGFGMFG